MEVLDPIANAQKRRFSKTITSLAVKNNQFGWIFGIRKMIGNAQKD